MGLLAVGSLMLIFFWWAIIRKEKCRFLAFCSFLGIVSPNKGTETTYYACIICILKGKNVCKEKDNKSNKRKNKCRQTSALNMG